MLVLVRNYIPGELRYHPGDIVEMDDTEAKLALNHPKYKYLLTDVNVTEADRKYRKGHLSVGLTNGPR